MKIVTISGGKFTKKDWLAHRLAENSDVVYVRPYTDKKIPIYDEEDYIYLNEKQLSAKMNQENPLVVFTTARGNRYIFFENQLRTEFCVLILDDAGVHAVKKEFGNNVITIRVHSRNEKPSDRVLMKDSEYDIVFNVDTDDYFDLENKIEYW